MLSVGLNSVNSVLFSWSLSNPSTSGETQEWTTSGTAIFIKPCLPAFISELYTEMYKVSRRIWWGVSAPQNLFNAIISMDQHLQSWPLAQPTTFEEVTPRWGEVGVQTHAHAVASSSSVFHKYEVLNHTVWGDSLSQVVAAPKEGATSAGSGQNLWSYSSWSHPRCLSQHWGCPYTKQIRSNEIHWPVMGMAQSESLILGDYILSTRGRILLLEC